MRINANNAELPGVQTERVVPWGADVSTEMIYVDGAFIGLVSYVRRGVKSGTQYGWMPSRSHGNTALTTKTEAIRNAMLRAGVVR